MKKRIFATMMVLLLSAAMLAGCGDSSTEEDRSSRSKNEQTSKDNDDRDSSKKDKDKEDSPSAAGDEQDRENTSNATENEQEANPPATNSGEAYAEDLKALLTLFAMEDIPDDDPERMMSELQTLIDGMNVRTPEALVIKADLQELVDILNNLLNVMNNMDDPEALENLDLNILTDVFTKIDELSTAIEEHTETFINAAEASGMDEDTLKEIEDLATSLGFF